MSPQIPLPPDSTPRSPVVQSWTYSSLIIEMRKDLYFLITIFAVIAPLIIEFKPQWAGSIQKIEDVTNQLKIDSDLKIVESKSKITGYEDALKAAWAKDKDQENLKRLKYLYHKTQIDAMVCD